MPKESAGILLYRRRDGALELFLVHPGGPFWARKEVGAWSIPKGEPAPGEDLLDAAKREFREETGHSIDGDFRRLAPVRQPGGKIVHAFAVAGDCDAGGIKSNVFMLEWPPRSGRQRRFPEIDRAGWFAPAVAKEKLTKGQVGLVDALLALVGTGAADAAVE